MKIGVDAGCLGISDKRLQVGVYQVVKNLLAQLGKQDSKNEYILYSFYPIEKQILKEFGIRMKNVVVHPARGWLKIWLPLQLIKDNVDVFLALNQSSPLKLPIQKYKVIGIFYDIAFEKFPKLYAYAASVRKHKENSRQLAKNADKIIAISASTKKDLEKLYHVPSEKIVVGYPGITKLPKTATYKNINPYFLFVGSFKKSKNIPTLLTAFSSFYEKSKNPYDLVLIGGDKWMDPEIVEYLDALPKEIKGHVKILGFVSETQLSSLFRGAVAFVDPSWYEGFGLPFVEAQSIGCPVIGSTAGSLPEVLKDSAVLIDPKSVRELALAMSKISTDSVLRQQIIAKGYKNAQEYTWKRFANTVQSALENLL